MAFFETRDAGNLYYLKGHTRDTAKYAYMQQVGVSSTTVHRSCLSRGLERVIRVELCGQCRIYARRQVVHLSSNYVRPPTQLQHTDEHTKSSRHHPLPKSQYTPLFRNPSRRARPQRYTQQLPPNHILPPSVRSYTRPRTRHPNSKPRPRNLGRSIY